MGIFINVLDVKLKLSLLSSVSILWEMDLEAVREIPVSDSIRHAVYVHH